MLINPLLNATLSSLNLSHNVHISLQILNERGLKSYNCRVIKIVDIAYLLSVLLRYTDSDYPFGIQHRQYSKNRG
jgi:hypothetical protein